jgi:(2Fe-2S) ferredoxin
VNTAKPHYDFHIFVCQNHRLNDPVKGCCLSKGSDKLLEHMKMQVKDLGIANIKVTKSGCLSQCSRGIALVIYPQGVWYSIKSTDDVNEIITSHIKNNKLVNHLLI